MQSNSEECVFLDEITIFHLRAVKFHENFERTQRGDAFVKTTTGFPLKCTFKWALSIRDDRRPCLLVESQSSNIYPRAVFDVIIENHPPLLINWPARQSGKLEFPLTEVMRDSFLRSSNLTAQVTVTISRKADSLMSLPEKCQKAKFEDQFKALLDTPTCSDVTIELNDGMLSAHWVILAARSPFFLGMMNSSLEEKLSGKIKLDMNYQCARKMLEYIYTDRVEFENVEQGQTLLEAADIYLIEGLKNLAEKFLCDRIWPNNALELLVLGHLHNADVLKRAALDLLSSCPSFATECDHFSNFCTHHPEAMAELLERRAEKVYKVNTGKPDLGRSLYTGLGRTFFVSLSVGICLNLIIKIFGIK